MPFYRITQTREIIAWSSGEEPEDLVAADMIAEAEREGGFGEDEHVIEIQPIAEAEVPETWRGRTILYNADGEYVTYAEAVQRDKAEQAKHGEGGEA